MNKRIRFLLATLLIAESAMPLAAQSLDGQTRTDLLHSINNTKIIHESTPVTTPPSISVKFNRIDATDIAGAMAKIEFKLENIELKDPYVSPATSLHMALNENMKFTSITTAGAIAVEEINQPGIVTIYGPQEFTYEFKADNIDPDSIRKYSYFTFRIPGYLLTKDIDLEVEVEVNYDEVGTPEVLAKSNVSGDTKLVDFKTNKDWMKVRYTLDGSEVSLNSPLYDKKKSIEVGPNDILKVVAYAGTMSSEQLEIEYNEITVENNPSIEEDKNTSESPSIEEDKDTSESPSVEEDKDTSKNPSVEENKDTSKNPSVEEDKNTNESPSVEEDKDTNEVTLGVTNASQVSSVVTSLIEQKERELTTQVTPVQYGLRVNGKNIELENSLLVKEGRTLASIRTIMDALNIPVQYHQESKTVIIQKGSKTIEFPLGYNVAIVNGEMIQIDPQNTNIKSIIQNNRSYLPLRFIAEQFNLNIHFDGKQIHINSLD